MKPTARIPRRDALRHCLRWTMPGAAIILLCVAASCRTAAPVPPEACAGQSMLVVRNQTRQPLDIYLQQSTTNRIVGVAAPGRTEFSLLSIDVPKRSRFVARRQGGAFLSTHNDSVTFSHECR